MPEPEACRAVQIDPFDRRRRRNLSQTGGETTLDLVTLALTLAADPGVSSRAVATATKTTGTRIREAREAAGYNRHQLAKLAELDYSQLRKWELDLHVPGPASLRRLTPFIGGSTDYFLFGDK